MNETLLSLDTPSAIIDHARMQANVRRMQQRMDSFGANFRPHVKTSKCTPVALAQLAAGARGITVSTLKEARHFFAAGITDILYAVGISPDKLPQALALREAGCDLKVITDNIVTARAIVEFCRAHACTLEVWIEIDCDGHRSGIRPADEALLEVGRLLAAGPARLGGVLTHAGSSYACRTPAALAAIAEQERAGCVQAAERLRAAGLPCPHVSIGSTPTALGAHDLTGVTEVRAGVYVFFDLVMHNVGVCRQDEIALFVLTTVIGHQAEKGWAIVDAGWMALSRDRGTQKQARDFGYGQICDLDGTPLAGYTVCDANQEHGIVAHTNASGPPDADIVARFPIGSRLLVLPNHACATGAQFPEYHCRMKNGECQTWPRLYGW